MMTRAPGVRPHSTRKKKDVSEIVRQEPRSIKQGLQSIAAEIGKVISGDTLKKMLRAEDYRWKRMRRSARSFRDEAEFRAAQGELAGLRAAALCAGLAYAITTHLATHFFLCALAERALYFFPRSR